MTRAVIGCFVLTSILALPQAPTAFEVASVRPSPPGARFSIVFTPGRFTARSATVERLIYTAFDAPAFLVVDAPKWISEERFDVLAKAPDAATPSTGAEIRAMLRDLLTERFALRTHTEVRELRVYALVLDRDDGRLGHALRPTTLSDEDCAAQARSPEPVDGPRCGVSGRMSMGRDASTFETRFGRMTLGDIANQLAHQVERPIVDQTGLQGRFDLELAFRPTSLSLPPTPSGGRAARKVIHSPLGN